MQKLLSAQKMAEQLGVSVPTIWRWAKAGRLPKPTKLSPGCSRWKESDIQKLTGEPEGGEAA